MREKKNATTSRRTHARIPVQARVQVFWDESGTGMRTASGRCVDVSESGVRLELSEVVPNNTPILMRLEDPDAVVYGVVRHSSLNGAVGVELRTDTPIPSLVKKARAFKG
ncbi:MAG TPA: PilZ domain-containing protein [Terriglobia bacterium]|jgi:hypothetical protein